MIQLTLTLKMTTAQVVKTSVTVNNNSPIQDYIHPDDQTQPSVVLITNLLYENLLVITNLGKCRSLVTGFYCTNRTDSGFQFWGASGDIPCLCVMYQKFVLAKPCKPFNVKMKFISIMQDPQNGFF